ncbi:MAG: acyl-CoA dehydrogenase family protein, partial [Anaerolineales bacterium]|nr:acyl-CoA dehydrogenase family protein [Anaerolineales bacterium]
MDFALNDEQRMVQQMVRDFAQKEVAPIIKEYDRKQDMAPFVLPRMAELGILGICFPVRYGGQGMDYISLGLACEELEAVDSTLRVVMSVHVGLNSMGLLQWATEEQKQRLLVPQAKGEKIASFGLTEPGAGTDVAGMASTARRDGDVYVLNGEKMWISLATKAHTSLVVARTNPEAPNPHEGLSAFLVELDSPGVTTGDIHGKLGVRAGSTGWIAFQDVRVPAENRIGEEGEGFKIAMMTFEHTRTSVATYAVGVARAAYEYALDYAQERVQFGKPIIRHQAIGFMLADMAIMIDAARLLCWRAAALADQGKPCMKEASMAKAFAGDMAMQVTTDAVQVLGGYGYSREYPVEKWMRDAKIMQIYEGT